MFVCLVLKASGPGGFVYLFHRRGEPAERWSGWSCPDPSRRPECRSAFSRTLWPASRVRCAGILAACREAGTVWGSWPVIGGGKERNYGSELYKRPKDKPKSETVFTNQILAGGIRRSVLLPCKYQWSISLYYQSWPTKPRQQLCTCGEGQKTKCLRVYVHNTIQRLSTGLYSPDTSPLDKSGLRQQHKHKINRPRSQGCEGTTKWCRLVKSLDSRLVGSVERWEATFKTLLFWMEFASKGAAIC